MTHYFKYYKEPKPTNPKSKRVEDSKEALRKVNAVIGWIDTFEDMTAHLDTKDSEQNALLNVFKADTLDKIKQIVKE